MKIRSDSNKELSSFLLPILHLIHHNYHNKTFCNQEPEMVQQNSFKDKTINYCKHATPLYKADMFSLTLDTRCMNTNQSVNFLEVSFLQNWAGLWPWLFHNVYDYSRRKSLFSRIPLSPQVKWLLVHVDIQEDGCLPSVSSACGHRVIHRLKVAAQRLFSLKITTGAKKFTFFAGLSHWVTSTILWTLFINFQVFFLLALITKLANRADHKH